MKATDLLVNQHREVEQLFDQLESVEEGDKRVVREELAKNLVAHSVIEKEILYPALRSAAPEDIAEAYEEHGVVEITVFRLLETGVDDEAFPARAKVLRELVKHHTDEEESELLKKAESTLGEEQLNELGTQMEARFEQVREEGYETYLQKAILEALPTRAMPSEAAAASEAAPAAKAKRTARRRPAKRAATKRTAAKRGTAKRGAAKRGAAAKRGSTAKRGAAKRTTGKRATAKRGTSRTTSTRGSAGGRANKGRKSAAASRGRTSRGTKKSSRA